MRNALPLLVLTGCLFEREPPCATGYTRDAAGECVENTDYGGTKVTTGACTVAFTSGDFGCEGANVVVTTNVDCVTAGDSRVNLIETGTAGGLHEEHPLNPWNVDPTGTWEQLDVVLSPGANPGEHVADQTTAYDCVILGEPVITAVLRSYDLGTLVDCAIVSNDPAGPSAVFDGSAPGMAGASDAADISAANCTIL